MKMGPIQVVSSLLIMLNQKPFMLIRIEFLVVAISGLFFAMFVLDFRRNRSHGAVGKSVLKVLDGVSDQMVGYALGVMQAADIDNELFPVWGMLLLSFRSSVRYISEDARSSSTGMGYLVQSFTLARLKGRRASWLKVQLWCLWSLQLMRSLYRIIASGMAENSRWNGLRKVFLPEFMRCDHERSMIKPEACNPSTMEGYAFLVFGESKQRIRVLRPRYVLYLDIIRPESLVTLDKIWQCDGRLLCSSSSRGDHLKDLCLAFALSGLLRCGPEDGALHRDCLLVTRNLVRSRILVQSAGRAFRILETEVSFLNERQHTWYPLVFWHGLLSLSLNVLRSLVTIAVVSWLAADIRRLYRPLKGDMDHRVCGVNIDIIITLVLMLFMIFKEIWETITFLLSDWTRLLLVCKYVQWRWYCVRNSHVERVIWSFFTSRISHGRWHGLIDQYEFLQSFDYIPSMWNRLHRVTLGMVPERDLGTQLGSAIKIPECVKPAVMRALRSMNLDGGRLPEVIPALSASSLMDSFGWACKLPSCSHVVLVWHIATSFCEINLAQDCGVSLSKPRFPRSALSWLTSCCRFSQPYLVDEKILDDNLKTNYLVANSLSRYCAYLLISQPDLLPDSFMTPSIIFQAAVHDACKILQGHDSLDSRYKRLTEEAHQANQDDEAIKVCGNVLKQAALLGRDLTQINDKELRWKILAGVWAALFVHIAPTWNTTAHMKRLEFGGEFITHIWALLCHFGIEKSSLWRREEAATGAHHHWQRTNQDAQ
ncbi:hypothetical protein ACP70R_007662 [Stipagrostis hirtigluma subsp. patula]